MNYIYFDHNSYIKCLEDENTYHMLQSINDNNNQCIYSPAHIEEIYKTVATNSKYASCKDKMLEIISNVTCDMEALPVIDPSMAIVIKKEKPIDCYKRVKGTDTTERVKLDSITRFMTDKANYKPLMSNKKYTNISNADSKEIWKWPQISDSLNNLNSHINDFILLYNNYNIMLKLCGLNRDLPDSFCFAPGRYKSLKHCFNELEPTIEILFRILNHWGYNSEKSEDKSISGTHDVTHAIYATVAKFFITTDERFYKKCRAVYDYLGVDTQIILTKEDQIMKAINIVKK